MHKEELSDRASVELRLNMTDAQDCLKESPEIHFEGRRQSGCGGGGRGGAEAPGADGHCSRGYLTWAHAGGAGAGGRQGGQWDFLFFVTVGFP